MKKGLVFFLILTLLNSFCSRNQEVKKTEKLKLKIANVEVDNVKISRGALRGANFQDLVYYISHNNPDKKELIDLKIMDMKSGSNIKTVVLNRGSYQSPTDFYNPAYVKYLNGKYYVCDQYHKIVVFNKEFKISYSSNFFSFRHFISFFNRDGNVFFFIGKLKDRGLIKGLEIIQYRLFEVKRPEKINEIDVFTVSLKKFEKYERESEGKYWNSYQFLPAGFGFVKNKKLYYSVNIENGYYVYDIERGTKITVKLDYLKEKIFSLEDAKIIGFYKSDGWEERLYRKKGIKVRYIPFFGKLYHFGIYDVGKNEIGIIGDIDINKMHMRLDIFFAESSEYKESFWLPIGKNFLNGFSRMGPAFFPIYINIQKGIYIWEDKWGENIENVVILSRLIYLNNGGEIKK
ncbi:MAG: hypothetical protein ACFE9R_13320 [Candidatus Hermodarchaeota archaeon]